MDPLDVDAGMSNLVALQEQIEKVCAYRRSSTTKQLMCVIWMSSRVGSTETGVSGAVGVVVALIEEESVTDDAAQAGRAAFNREVEKGINEIIPTLREEGNFSRPPTTSRR
jgi:hypothetical protein